MTVLKGVTSPAPAQYVPAYTSHVFSALLLDFAAANRQALGGKSNTEFNAMIRRFLKARKDSKPTAVRIVTLALGKQKFIGSFDIRDGKIRVRYDERWSKSKSLSDTDDPESVARTILHEMVQARSS